MRACTAAGASPDGEDLRRPLSTGVGGARGRVDRILGSEGIRTVGVRLGWVKIWCVPGEAQRGRVRL
jgi:hypothetical protein